MHWRLLQQLMVLGIHLTVPRHRMGVSVVATDEAGRILLLHHVFHPYTPWGLPGGWLGRNESPQECALRELREETGLTGSLGPVVHMARDSDVTQLSVAYLALVTPGPLQLGAEIMGAEWFPADALPSPLLPFTRAAIAAALAVRASYLREEHIAG